MARYFGKWSTLSMSTHKKMEYLDFKSVSKKVTLMVFEVSGDPTWKMDKMYPQNPA